MAVTIGFDAPFELCELGVIAQLRPSAQVESRLPSALCLLSGGSSSVNDAIQASLMPAAETVN